MQVANVCSYIYISWAKNEFQFLCELGWFLHGQSHNNYKHACTTSHGGMLMMSQHIDICII